MTTRRRTVSPSTRQYARPSSREKCARVALMAWHAMKRTRRRKRYYVLQTDRSDGMVQTPNRKRNGTAVVERTTEIPLSYRRQNRWRTGQSDSTRNGNDERPERNGNDERPERNGNDERPERNGNDVRRRIGQKERGERVRTGGKRGGRSAGRTASPPRASPGTGAFRAPRGGRTPSRASPRILRGP